MKRRFLSTENDIKSTTRTQIKSDQILMNPDKKMIIFDTETSDIKPGNICQLSYLIVDDKDITSKDFYFKVKDVAPGAQNVHGFSVEDLKRLSNNKTFNDQYKEIYKDFSQANVLVAHNIEFDMKFLKAEFTRINKAFDPDNLFCTMKHFTNICKIKRSFGTGYKWPKLSELSEFLKIDPKERTSLSTKLFGGSTNAHDARGDIVETYLCLKEGLKKEYIKSGELDISSYTQIKTKREIKPLKISSTRSKKQKPSLEMAL